MPLNTQEFAGIPTDVMGRLTADDYIFFTWDSDLLSFNPAQYDVAIESDSGTFVNVTGPPNGVGHLDSAVQLPALRYSSGTLVVVIPKQLGGPRFVGTLQRGKTYRLSLQGKRLHDPMIASSPYYVLL